MPNREIAVDAFANYAPDARALVAKHISLLQRLPDTFLPILLVQIKQYDYAFPAEREKLSSLLAGLETLDTRSFASVMGPFAAIQLPPQLLSQDWINNPQQFSESLTAWLWSQHRIDEYHKAAENYLKNLPATPRVPIVPRSTFVLLGREISESPEPLFRKLAPHGTVFSNVDASDGLESIFSEAVSRSRKYPAKYAHWYIEGGDEIAAPELTTLSYSRLVPAILRSSKLVQEMPDQARSAKPSTVESVTSYVASLGPEALGLKEEPDIPLRHFKASVLTQGAGCQIFSTTFVQWAARECLHRAEPLTLIARFGTRQVLQPMERLMGKNPLSQPQDARGSLLDADMGAYYTWINQSRLPGSDASRFLAWWDRGGTAVAVSPGMALGTKSAQRVTIAEILKWMA